MSGIARVVVLGPAASPHLHDAIAALDPVEREFLATVTALLVDPAMAPARNRFRAGEITLAIEGDEVTWIDCDQVAAELAHRIGTGDGR